MTQPTAWSVPLVGPCPPDVFAGRIDDSLDALLSSHSGSSRPSYAVAGTEWVSTALAGKLKYYVFDGAVDRLIKTIDTATGSVIYSDGTVDDVFGKRARRGHLFGLALSNNASDATNDIDIAIGECASDDTSPFLMVLSSAITKRLDAAWAVGSGNGGLDTGAIANTTYHLWLIQRSDTGVVDALFSASATSPTMPASYDRKRRIGSILREGGAIALFDQDEDIFMRRASSTTRNNTAAAASSLLTFAVPLGIPVRPITSLNFVASASVASTMALGSAASGAATFTACSVNTGVGGQAAAFNEPPPVFTTNTSAQLYFSQVNSVGTPAASTVLTLGWVDRRGRT